MDRMNRKSNYTDMDKGALNGMDRKVMILIWTRGQWMQWTDNYGYWYGQG